MQFNQPEGEIQIRMPPDLNQRVENLKEACPELLEAGDEWPTKVEDSLAEWMDLKADIEMLTGWIATAESEFGSIQNIPKFLMDFNALEDRFQVSIHFTCTVIVIICFKPSACRLVRTWFLKISFVCTSVCVSLCMCLCVYL